MIKIHIIFFISILLFITLVGCGRILDYPELDTTAPAAPSNFSTTTGNAQVVLSWTNPSDSDFAGVMLRRKTGSYPASVTDGTEIYSGSSTSYTDTGLTNGTTYYYSIWAKDAVPNWSSANQVLAVPIASATDTTAPAAPSSFSTTTGNAQVVLSWINPSDSDFTGVMLRRKTGSYPSSVTDGTEIYSGSSTSYTDTGLTNGTTYYYSIWAKDAVPNWSNSNQMFAMPMVLTIPAGTVVLLLHFDGNYTDSSASNYTLNPRGSPQLDTNLKKFGTGSINFDGVQNHVRIDSPGNNLVFGTAAYTIDFWIQTNDSEGYVLNTDGGTSNGNTAVLIQINGGKVKLIEKVNGTENTITSATSVTDLNWHHIAIVRESSGGSKLYIDGTLEGQQSAINNISAGGEFNLGSDNDSANSTRYIDSNLDEVRVIKGGAYWSGNFSPPSLAY